jgi:restriction system protein
MTQVWQVNRKPHRIDRTQEFLGKDIIAIGWARTGDLTGIQSKNELAAKIIAAYPEEDYSSKQRLSKQVGEVFRFLVEMQEGDYVILVSEKGRVHIGEIHNYFFDQSAASEDKGYAHQRKVTWLWDLEKSERNRFMPELTNSQGTVFRSQVAADKIKKLIESEDSD